MKFVLISSNTEMKVANVSLLITFAVLIGVCWVFFYNPFVCCDSAAACAVSIDSQYGGAGRGVMVGYSEAGNERVFLLTARHVATFGDLISKDMSIRFSANDEWKFPSNNSRWLTCSRDIDAAWVELNHSEIEDLRNRGLLKNASLSNGVVNYQDYLKQNDGNEKKVRMLLRDGEENGSMRIAPAKKAPIPFLYNRNLRTASIPILEVRSEKMITPGDSGCPVFMNRKRLFGKSEVLIGLGVGGNSILQISAVMPMDDIVKAIKSGGRRLIDHPELW